MGATSVGSRRVPSWLAGLGPLIVIGALVALFLQYNPIADLRSVPPVEAISFERVVFEDDGIRLHVRNDGPDEVRIAQVLVNDAYWAHDVSDRVLGRLDAATVEIAYPWEAGLPVGIALVTSTGLTIEHDVEAAALTPSADARTLGIYSLLGLYIGVVPVAIGLLWFPALRDASRRWLGFFLAFTIGLLVFLFVDTVVEGLEIASEAASVLDGRSLFVVGALVALTGLTVLERSLERRAAGLEGLVIAYLVAAGIGLHNLGEGLAVGAALAAGEVALGTFLVLGFALHNTTEGLAIVAPLGGASRRPALAHFVALGALAGIPTILGAWAGGFAFSAAAASLAFGVAAGAIAQVVWVINRSMARARDEAPAMVGLGFVAGLAAMYLTGLLAV